MIRIATGKGTLIVEVSDLEVQVTIEGDGGPRIPSEARELPWAVVDWERGRLLVTSPKYPGQDSNL